VSGTASVELSAAKRALLEERLRGRGGSAPAEGGLVPRSRPERVRASVAQEQFWFLHQLDPASPLYNVPVLLLLEGELDRDALERALRTLVERHEALRTVLVLGDGGAPFQVVLPELSLALEKVDAPELGADEESIRQRTAEHVARPFDLAQGPLLRALLLRLAPDRHALTLTAHHAVWDAWSLDVVVSELDALYDAFARGAEPELEPLPVQYADFALWERERLESGALDRDLDFWREALAGDPAPVALPLDHPRPASAERRSEVLIRPLPDELTAAVRAFAAGENATLYMTGLAAFAALLARTSAQLDVLVGTPVAGRPRPELEGLIGCFINLLVQRTSLEGRPTFREVVRRVRTGVVEAFAHQELPFGRVVDDLAPARDDDGGVPFASVAFSVQPRGRDRRRLGPLDVHWYRPPTPQIAFDLLLILDDDGERLSSVWAYLPALFDAATVERLAEEYEQLLAQAVAAPDEPLELAPAAPRPAPAPAPQPERAPAPAVEALAVPPEVEEGLQEIWRLVLGREAASLDEHFFDAGGQSLLALQVVLRARRRFETDLAIPTFLARPTLRTLAEEVVRALGPGGGPSPLVRLREGSGVPLVLVHPVGGDVSCYTPLGERVDGHPLYGLASLAPAEGIPELADGYLAALREAGLEPPLVLGGWSMGGAVAFEMACRLAERDGFAAPVVLVDPSGPSPAPEEDERQDFVRGFLYHVARALGVPLPDVPTADAEPGDALAAALAELRAAGADPGVEVEELLGRFEIFRGNALAALRYHARFHHGAAYLLEPEERATALAEWQPLCASIEAHRVPGDHFGLLEGANADVVARLLAQAVRAVTPDSPPPAPAGRSSRTA